MNEVYALLAILMLGLIMIGSPIGYALCIGTLAAIWMQD